MSALWNLANTLKSSHMNLLNSGRELFGTVIQQGVNKKTVTVRVDYEFWNKKYKTNIKRANNFQVHDQEDFCRNGDKVVIKHCEKLSPTKYYFVRNVVKQFPRNDYYDNLVNKDQKQDLFQNEFQKVYKEFLSAEMKRTIIKNKKQDSLVKHKLKLRAMSKAQMNLKQQKIQPLQSELDQKTEKI